MPDDFYIDSKKISTSEDFINFLFDSYVRTFEIKESLYEFFNSYSNKKKWEFCAPLHKNENIWRKIFLKKIETIYDNIRIGSGEYKKINKIEFDYRLGWTFINKDSYSFLGKVDFSENTKINIGNFSYFSGPGVIKGRGVLNIGNFTNIGENVFINVEIDKHPIFYPAIINWKQNLRLKKKKKNFNVDYKDIDYSKNEINIGSDVWLARDVRLLSGINISNGAVVAEKSFVNRDCAPYGIYAGLPAKLKSFRFSANEIKKLEKMKWWNWSFEKIYENKSFFKKRLK